MQEKRHDRVVEMRLCFFSGKVGDYKMLFVATRKCRSTFDVSEEKGAVLRHKRAITDCISAYLAKQDLPRRKCSRCGRDLPWNYPYGMCNKCYVNNPV